MKKFQSFKVFNSRSQIFLALLFFVIVQNSIAQQVELFKGKQFVHIDTNWFSYSGSGANQLTEVDKFHLSVKLKDGFKTQGYGGNLGQSFGIEFLRLSSLGWADYHIPSHVDFFQTARNLMEDPHVQDVDIHYYLELSTVNDEYMNVPPGTETVTNSQWSLKRFGLEQVWSNFGHGNRNSNVQGGTVVAVFDTGLDITHPDIGQGNDNYHNLWTNYAELNGVPGYDDDQNGVIDDIHGAFYDENSPVPQSNITDEYPFAPSHGTHVSGIIAAKTNNDIGIAGLAGGLPNTLGGAKIMTIKIFGAQRLNSTIMVDDAIDYAVAMGAKVMNMSFRSEPSQAINEALNFASNSGIFIIAAGGNHANLNLDERLSGNGAGTFPANHPKVMGIGNGYGNYNSPADKLLTVNSTSFWGNHIDIYAPGTDILSTVKDNQYRAETGTSMAAPWIASIAALMLDINPCLSISEIKNILTSTSTKPTNQCANPGEPPAGNIFDPTIVAYNRCMDLKRKGYINPGLALAITSENTPANTNPDIYIKDAMNDFGKEPYTSGYVVWESPDIWVRQLPDGLTNHEHQNPQYNSNLVPVANVNYVYVRLRNRSCNPFFNAGGAKVRLNWAKAGVAGDFPAPWDGNTFIPNTTTPLGGEIGLEQVSYIPEKGDVILEFAWQLPDPQLYNTLSDNWYYCLLASFDDANDPISSPSLVLRTLLENNNNIAMKNLSIMRIEPLPPGQISDKGHYAAIYASNLDGNYGSQNFTLREVEQSTEQSVFSLAKVSVQLTPTLFNSWMQNGMQGHGIEVEKSEHRVYFTSDSSSINNLDIPSGEIELVKLEVNFLANKDTSDFSTKLRLVAQNGLSGDVMNGETFLVSKKKSKNFKANAGADKYVMQNQPYTLQAENLGDGFEYSWVDKSNDTLYNGDEITLTAQTRTAYTLLVKDELSGFIDFDSCNVFLIAGEISLVYPNPASESVEVQYELLAQGDARLLLINSTGNICRNEEVDSSLHSKILSLSSLNPGLYTVLLTSHGQIVDSANLLKQ